MMMKSITALMLAVGLCMPFATSKAQLSGAQSNSPEATLLWNGASGSLNLMQGQDVVVQMLGQPSAFLLLGEGVLASPGPEVPGAGFINLSSLNNIVFDGSRDPTHFTDNTGQFQRTLHLPWLATPGTTWHLQGAVEDSTSSAGYRLTAPTSLTVAPTTITPQHLFFNPSLAAKGIDTLLPPAGTLPGDLPTLDPNGFPGPTQIFSNGEPVHGVFDSPFYCYACHGAAQDIWPSYMGTMMANSMRDPLFNAQFSVAVAGYEYLNQQGAVPFDGTLAADFCIRCHSPNAWQGGRSDFEGDGVTQAFTPGVFDHQHSLDMEGVLCDTCHRTTGFAPNASPTKSVVPGTPDSSQLIISHSTAKRGPYSGNYNFAHAGSTPYGAHISPVTQSFAPPVAHSPPAQPGSAISPGHDTTQGANLGDSSFCGTCHNITNPVSGHEIERTYTEWENSAYGDPQSPDFQSCQDCHMPAQPNVVGCNLAGVDPTYGAYNKVRSALRQHEFVGGNAWIPQILKQMYPLVDLPWTNGQNYRGEYHFGNASRNAAYDITTMRAIQKLRDAATVDLAATEIAPNTIDANVTITNLSGHKLPTGYSEGRQMWVQVEALDANDVPFYQSGMLDSNSALIRDSDLKVYEAKHGMNYPGLGIYGPTFHFALNNFTYKDNRILPKGSVQIPGKGGNNSFDPLTAPWPTGGLYPDGQYWDTTNYTIAVPANISRPISVRATVFYQTSSWEYVNFLANGGDSIVQTMPHADAVALRNFWTSGMPAPAVPVGNVGAGSTVDPNAVNPGQTALVVIP